MIELRPYQKQAISEAFIALKRNDDPVLLECSVGGGKSYIIASIAKRFNDLNKKVLCLVSSAELVRNNSDAYRDCLGEPSIFCASLSNKNYDQNVIFATPQSLASALKKNHPIGNIRFNIIIVDEAHGINYYAKKSTFIRVLRHYKQEYPAMRVLGLTGTPFRRNVSIVGKKAFFKSKVGNISTHYLIENNYLVKPIFDRGDVESFDFSHCKIRKTGHFKGSDLQTVIDNKKRLTWDILQEVQMIMRDKHCVIIFCSTRAHCFEAYTALPPESTRIILGDTPDEERNTILTLARQCKIKYLISVNCLLVGVNVPCINGIVWLRPTSSLLLFIQGIGRGLRLYPEKTDCLVLDYAGNLDRFQDLDHPIINEAIQPRMEDEKDYCIPCYDCSTLNTIHSRRCIGIVSGQRCEHYFEFKECPGCCTQNDITSRECRNCHAELIDPNAKLKLTKKQRFVLNVNQASYWVSCYENSGHPIIHVKYECQGKNAFEQFFTRSEKGRQIFYALFIKQHCVDSSEWYPHLTNLYKMREMINDPTLKTPHQIECSINEFGQYKVLKKIFN